MYLGNPISNNVAINLKSQMTVSCDIRQTKLPDSSLLTESGKKFLSHLGMVSWQERRANIYFVFLMGNQHVGFSRLFTFKTKTNKKSAPILTLSHINTYT